MSIVRGRDIKFAKRRIPEIESKIDTLQMELDCAESELYDLQKLVEEHDEEPAIKPYERTRPSNEANLSQFVSA